MLSNIPPNLPNWLAAIWPFLSLPFFGGLIGALIGGLFAFTVARIQIHVKEVQEAQDWFNKTYLHEGIYPIMIFVQALRMYVRNAASTEFLQNQPPFPEIPREAIHRVAELLNLQSLPYEFEYITATAHSRISEYHTSMAWRAKIKRVNELFKNEQEIIESSLKAGKVLHALNLMMDEYSSESHPLHVVLQDASEEIKNVFAKATEDRNPEEIEKVTQFVTTFLLTKSPHSLPPKVIQETIDKVESHISNIEDKTVMKFYGEAHYLSRLDKLGSALIQLGATLSIVHEHLLNLRVRRKYNYKALRMEISKSHIAELLAQACDSKHYFVFEVENKKHGQN